MNNVSCVILCDFGRKSQIKLYVPLYQIDNILSLMPLVDTQLDTLCQVPLLANNLGRSLGDLLLLLRGVGVLGQRQLLKDPVDIVSSSHSSF